MLDKINSTFKSDQDKDVMKLYKDEDLDQILEIAKDNDIAEKNIFDCFSK